MGKAHWVFAIGNPPYQESRTNTKDMPVYNEIMDAVDEIADKVEMITPGRFLFNAGATPKAWNEKMLSDPHFKVLDYEADSAKVFPNTDIKGGVAIHYHDATQEFEPVGLFSAYPEVNSLRLKMDGTPSISEIMVLQVKFNLPELYKDHPEMKSHIGSNGKERRFTSNIFERVPLFSTSKQNADDITVYGIENNIRVVRYFPRKYIDMSHKNLMKYKVLVPKSNGSGAIGETLSTPLIGSPLIGYTFSYIGIGSFDTKNEADNTLKYIKTKFVRACLGILKITQDNLPEKWKYVPLQDFTSASDIDWSKSIPEIDQQLYRKYGLSDDEVKFIEEHVKAME